VSHDEASYARDDVRISDYAARVVRRWYIVVLCVVVAIGLVLLNSVGGNTKYQAQATVFMGQPLTPFGGQTITSSLVTNPTAAATYVRSDEVIKKAAAAAGVKARALRSHLTVTPQGGATAAKAAGAGTTVAITLRAPNSWTKDQATESVRSLADQLIQFANTYQAAKQTLLGEQVKTDQEMLDTLRRTVDRAHSALNALDRSSLSPLNKALAQGTLLSTISTAGSRIDDISLQMTQYQVFLAAAKTIEAAGYVQEPSVQSLSATGKRSSLIVAIFAGLIAGVILALLWDALRRPRRAD
jgi:hypothetical protein